MRIEAGGAQARLVDEAWTVPPRDRRGEAIDLLVLGTVARTGIAGYVIGNTAEAVLSQVTCSVLAVKPEGFVSPVAAEPAGA